MNRSFLKLLVCPNCKQELRISKDKIKNNEIYSGILKCEKCKKEYPIINYIPRFVDSKNYTQNFGYEFSVHPKTQLDSYTKLDICKNRFIYDTGWDKSDLKNNLVLEVGCGAGRFSEFPLQSGAELVSVDMSNAVDVNLKNLGFNPKHHIVQASIYNLPFRLNSFDKVFCLGVLQHTPEPKKSFYCLTDMAKIKGGKVSANCYQKTPIYMIQPKYIFRPITTRMSDKNLMQIVKKIVPLGLKFGKSVYKSRIPLISTYFKQFVPNFDDYPLTDEQWKDWATLIVFDWFSPKFDQPQTVEEVTNWVKEKNFNNYYVGEGVIVRVNF